MTVGRGAVIFGCAGPDLLPEERAFYREADPFGFIVFARNIETPGQLRRLTADLREAVGRDAPVLVDQEGGRVQRLRSPHWREWTPPLDTVDGAGSLEAAERVMRLRSTVMAAELAAVGIDADCIPTLDVVRPETHPFLMNRCYGRDPETVARIGRAVAEGLMAGGVLPVMKHMPGHGLSHVDTHHDLPTVEASHEELAAVDFAPFRALADLPMAMTAHLVFAALDPDRPATQSPRMIRVIREEIGFKGLLMSDDLNMQALSGTLAERTARTIAAGVDVALHCKGDMAEMVEVAGAAGAMGPEALARAEAAVAARRSATADVEAALAELAHG
ncbi:glycoside hydrolase family 3 protein [Tabrizicola sp.]|uniref:glycoside hydrolase family 3 protein n=1 Tax=Tabrizicola sp. TaxID=2005166 RepID=UPI002FDE1237